MPTGIYPYSNFIVFYCFEGKSKKERKIKVCFDKPVRLASPGLLKRKRKREKGKGKGKEDEVEGDRKRIRFSNLDSSGSPIDPQFSEDEDDDDRNQSRVIVDNIIDGLLSFVLKN